MKNYIPFVLLIWSSLSFAQGSDSLNQRLDAILASPQKVSIYEEPLVHSVAQEFILFEFASDAYESPDLIAFLQKTDLLSVSYIFSSFKSTADFDQNALNKKRLLRFHESFPNAREIDWTVIEQTGANSIEEASGFFHGFVIHYREHATQESIAAEISFLKEAITNTETALIPEKILSLVEYKKQHPFPKNDQENYWYIKNLNAHKQRIKRGTKIDTNYSNLVADTTIISVLERNPQWNNMLVVCDLTASMSPYISQLLVWFRVNMKKEKISYFTFFNDGDTKTDYKKEIGSTGGIYFVEADTFSAVLDVAEVCMSNTNGGDIQENDVEAIIKGLSNYKDSGDLILIADNWSKMRDYELINSIDKPVRVILCGSSNGIEVEYLNLVRASSGSIHTLQKDYMNLNKIKKGQDLIIGNQTFKLKGNRFVEVLDYDPNKGSSALFED